jgi:hypothetical protein
MGASGAIVTNACEQQCRARRRQRARGLCRRGETRRPSYDGTRNLATIATRGRPPTYVLLAVPSGHTRQAEIRRDHVGACAGVAAPTKSPRRSGTFAATSTADARRTGGRLVPETGGWAESSLLRRLWPRLVCDAGVSRGRWCARPGTLRPRRFRTSRRRISPCAGSRRPALALRRRPSCRSHSWGSA